jgi:Asp-tRNA(Asn)/Glu-tRNA(Gln) amidotransferase A subunit family amidase
MSRSGRQPLGAVEAAAKIAAGELTSEELVEACLARIEALEPQVRAWAFLDRERALDQARAADATRKEGCGIGPLHGVPVGIKDIIDTADMPTENGCAIFRGRRPTEDAACVTALRRAGGIVLGKTATTELANMTPAPTRNPVNPEHTPGGSSAGSAAAVAAGMVPAAVGTQTAGSVIRPAAYCGVYGFKPSFGVIPRTGVLAQSTALDTVGVLGRSVEDVALLVDALQSYDAGDPASLATSRPRLLATATEEFPLPPIFAFVKTSAWGQAEPVTQEAFGELVEALGPQVNEINLDLTTEDGVAAARTIMAVEMAAHYGPLLDRAPELISKGLAERIEAGRRVPGVTYVAALAARERAYAAAEEVFTGYGTILTPAAPGPAPKDLGTTGDPVFCAFWTFLGVPAVTLPLLEADGMPMGVQLVGRRGDDGRLLRAARWLVELIEGKSRRRSASGRARKARSS